MSPPDGRPTVAHYQSTYLNLTENWIHTQLRFLRGFRSVVLAKRIDNRDQFPWEPVYALSEASRLVRQGNRALRHIVGYCPAFRRVARRERVRLIHGHFGHSGQRVLPLARALGVPLVTSFYGMDLSRDPDGIAGVRRRYRQLFGHGDLFLAEGPAAAQQLADIGAPAGRIRIHRLGVDPEEIPFLERRPAPGEPVRVLMAARFTEKKGVPHGVEAFCLAAREEPALRLTVAGGPTRNHEDRDIEGRVREAVRRHRMEDRIAFPGFLPLATLRALAREHHVFLQPSITARNGDNEGGHPVILTEASSSGMPCIGTRHRDIPEIVVDGETGWLCEEGDIERLAAALLEAARDPGRLAALGRGARRLVEKRYDARVNTLDAVYAEVLG